MIQVNTKPIVERNQITKLNRNKGEESNRENVNIIGTGEYRKIPAVDGYRKN